MSGRDFKVDFFCVGVAKAGTTTLHDLLGLQTGISLPRRKETNYFSFGLLGRPNYSGPLDESSVNIPTITSFEEYIDDFEFEHGSVIGEICPSYALDEAAANIYRHNPDAKIIILLREPVGRAYSNYQHMVRDGREQESFEDALAQENDRLAQGWEWFWGLKRNSLYFEMVKRYTDLFGNEKVKVLFFEAFVKEQKRHVEEVMDFIGLDPATARFEEIDSNKSGVVSGKWRFLHKALLSQGFVNSTLRIVIPPPVRKKLGAMFKSVSTVKGNVSAETRESLAREFSDDLSRLNKLIDGRVSHWLGEKNAS